MSADDPFTASWFDAQGNFVEGLCCAPCIYTFAVFDNQTYDPSATCPFCTWQSCCISSAFMILTGGTNLWMPIVGSITRSNESKESGVLSICLREWLCNVCSCAPCAMAEHIKQKKTITGIQLL